jgi:hypothetical protein
MKQPKFCTDMKQGVQLQGWTDQSDFRLNLVSPTLRVFFRRIAAMIKLYLAMIILPWMVFSPNVLAGCMDGTTVNCTLIGKQGSKVCNRGHWGACMVDESGDPNTPPPPPALHY